MKRIGLIIILTLIICGCKNKTEDKKNSYLEFKSKLLETKKYTKASDILCDISIDIDKKSEESIIYKVIVNNPREDMNNIKAIVVHNYYTEDVFPSVGLFDEGLDLKKNNPQQKMILKGKIETTEDISNINLKLKILIEYINNEGIKKDIYYKTT